LAAKFSSSRLRNKIIGWSFVPTAIILLTVALATFFAYQQVTQELVIQRDQEVVRLSARQLIAELAKYPNALYTVARAADVYSGSAVEQAGALARSSRVLAQFDGGVALLDTFGQVIASYPPNSAILGKDWSDRRFYREVSEAYAGGAARAAFSDIEVGAAGEVIAVAVPIIGERGEFRGVLTGMFQLGAASVSSFYGDIIKLRMGASGDTYIVDRNGRIIYHSNAALVGSKAADSFAVQQVLDGQTGASRIRDAHGVLMVASYAPVPDTSWGLITEEYWSVLTRQSQSYQQFLLALLLVGVLAPTIVATIGARKITQPVAELISAAQEVAQGDFSRTIMARTGDEIEDLATQFNTMSSQLRESYALLEQRVADRTKELTALNDIAATVSRSLDLDTILGDGVDKTTQLVNADAGGIYLLDEETQTLRIGAYRGISAEMAEQFDQLKVGEGFSGRVVASGQPMIVNEIAASEHISRQAAVDEGFHSLISVPLTSKGRAFGALFAVTRKQRDFTDRDIQLLASIGSQVGMAVENARLYAQAEDRLRQLEALYYADEELYRYLKLDQVLEALATVAPRVMGAANSAVFVLDKENRFKLRISHGVKLEALAWLQSGLAEEAMAMIAADGKPQIITDTTQRPDMALLVEKDHVRSIITMPINVKGQPFGVFGVGYREKRVFTQDDQLLAVALAQRAALAVENALLYERAQELATIEERQRLARDLHDAVTQTLFSASLIAEVLPKLWQRSPEIGRQRLEELRQLTRGALAEMRTLLLELRPSALMEAHLGDLLRQLAEATTGRSRIPVSVTIVGQGEPSSTAKVALYRIAQEALNNMIKHSGASQAEIHLDCGPGALSLVISDNGKGFRQADAPADHFGLGIMRERADSIGANLTVESVIGSGTVVRVTLRPSNNAI